MSTHSRQVDLTSGPLLKPLVLLSAPIFAAQLLQVVYNLTDAFWVGRLGADAVSAVSFSFPIVFVMLGVAGGITAGGSILVAQHVGAGDSERATRFAGQTLAVVTGLSLSVTIAGYLATPLLLRAIGAPPDSAVFEMAVAYTRIVFLGNFGTFGFFVFQAVFRGWGDTKTPLYLLALGVGLNLLLDPVLILGFDAEVFGLVGLSALSTQLFEVTGFQGLGVAGAAIATVGSRGVATTIGLWLLFRGRSGLAIEFDALRPRRMEIRRLLGVATPLAVEQSLTPIGIVAMTAIVALVDPLAVAGYGIGLRYVALVFLPAVGLAQGTEVAVGQNVGAGQPDRAQRATLLSVAGVVVVMGTVALFTIINAEAMVGVLVTGPDAAIVIDYGSAYLSTFAFGFAFLGAFRVFVAAFGGAGHSRKALAIALIELLGLRIPIPLALLTLGFGAYSVWYGMTIAIVGGTLVGGVWFFRGTWRTEGTDTSTGGTTSSA